MEPLLARAPDGTLSLLFLPREFATLLLELPAILDDDDRPEVRSRRHQDPTDDEDTNAEWQRMVREQLVHLFGEARDVVARDLELLSGTLDHPIGARLDIPPQHLNAWITALQMARVSLGAAHGLDDEMVDVEAVLAEPGERAQAMLRMHVLGDLQALLLQEIAPGVTEGGPGSDVDIDIDDDEDDDDDDDDDDDEDDDEDEDEDDLDDWNDADGDAPRRPPR